MGCTSSNTGYLPQLHTNEEKICKWEKELKLPAISAQTKINFIASKQEARGHIAEKNLSEYSDLLRCPARFRIFKSEKDNIMEQLYKKDNRTDPKKFKILVILLSKGTVKQKATLFHDVHQIYGENLRAKNVELLLNDIAHVSVHLIWAAMGKKMSQIPEEVLKSYESKLLEGKPLFVESSMKLLLQGRAFIPKSAFIKQVVKCPSLVSASGVRSLILKEYNDYYFLLSKNQINNQTSLPTEEATTLTTSQVPSQDNSPRTGFTSVDVTPRHTTITPANATARFTLASAKRSFSLMDPNNWKNEKCIIKPKLISENTLIGDFSNETLISLAIPEEIDSNNTSLIDIQLTPNNCNETFSFKNELDKTNLNDIMTLEGTKNNDAQPEFAIKITEPSDSIKISNQNKEQFESVKIELPSQWNVESSDSTKDSYTTTVVVSKEMVEQVKVLVTKKIKRRRPSKNLG